MRLVLRHRGEQTVTGEDLQKMLPATARLVDHQVPNLFLVDGDEADLRGVLQPLHDWIIVPEQFGDSATVQGGLGGSVPQRLK